MNFALRVPAIHVDPLGTTLRRFRRERRTRWAGTSPCPPAGRRTQPSRKATAGAACRPTFGCRPEPWRGILACALLLAPGDPSVLAAEPAAVGPSSQTVDFRYALPWWQSLVCLPDDPDKPLVGKEGQFFFDYGQKGPRKFAFSVALEVEGGSRWRRQETATPRAPILHTTQEAEGVELLAATFLPGPVPGDPDPALRLERDGGEVAMADWDGSKEKRALIGWAKPEVECDPAFRDVAFGANGTPIVYRLRVAAGGAAHLVFGFCEGAHTQPGQRLLLLSAEGAAEQVVDPVKDFGARRPGCRQRKLHPEMWLMGKGILELR